MKRVGYQLAAGKEYQHKTTGHHQLWATDASYFRVVGWGYYYLVTVMDDYSRFILAHKVQRDMTAGSLIEVVQHAVDETGMDQGASTRSGPGSSRIMDLDTSRVPSANTCRWWASATSWLRLTTLKPMGS